MPRSIISGSPPTERNARTGLFTPPTRTFSAFSKISLERALEGFACACIALIFAPIFLCLQPARRVLRVIRQDNACAGTLDSCQNFEDNSLFFDPILLCRRFHHGIFTTHVVGCN